MLIDPRCCDAADASVSRGCCALDNVIWDSVDPRGFATTDAPCGFKYCYGTVRWTAPVKDAGKYDTGEIAVEENCKTGLNELEDWMFDSWIEYPELSVSNSEFPIEVLELPPTEA